MINSKVYKSKTGQYFLIIRKKDGDALKLENKEEILINGIERKHNE